jgi:site-specific DNA-methyltransferase (adenine-specific)
MNIKNRPLKTQENILIFSKEANITFNPIFTKITDTSLKRDHIGVLKRNHNLKTSNGISHYGINKRRQSNLIYKKDGLKHPIDIIKFHVFENGIYKLKHPTKKPVALFEYLIKTYTNEGDLVWDGFAGSGTTGVACINTNRRFICVEKEKEYFEKAENRINEARKQVRLEI